MRSATHPRPVRSVRPLISIHALHAERDVRTGTEYAIKMISIHALHVERDVTEHAYIESADISIHALHVERDCRRRIW